MLIWLAVIIGAVLLDQLTKYLTVFYLKPADTVPLIEDVLHLTYVENTGAAFGMMKDNRWVFMTVSTVAIVGILVYLMVKRPTGRLECLSLSLIVGGGIGNMIDRFILGYVIDMIDFRLINFAVFNVADSFVCVGAGLMVLSLIMAMIKESRAEKAAQTLAAEGEENAEGDFADEDEVSAAVASEEPSRESTEAADDESSGNADVSEGENV